MIEPVFPLGMSIVVALIVLGVLLFFEFRRKLKYLALRVVSQTLLVSSILGLTLQPQLQITNHKPLILLTDGYDQNVIDSLGSLEAIRVPYNELPKVNGVKFVTGNGLPCWALDLLPSKNFTFIPSQAPKGITAIETDEHIYAHRWNTIRGTYHGAESIIKLRGPGGIEDSVKTSGSFSLSFFAKTPGRFNYELITPDDSETLPLIIESERVFNIIFVSDYPTFEVRYLKNFLASKGHRLSIRNQVSRGKYKFEFANRPSENFNSITPAILNEADLMMIDERSWNSLSLKEQRTIRTSIDNGLGIIMMPEDGKTQLLQFSKSQLKDTVRISPVKAGAIRLPVSTLEVKRSIPLLTSGDRVVNGFVYSGSGKIGYQLLMETYQAGLQGKTEMYSALWVPLLEKCTRAQRQEFKLRITSPFPYYENEPISFDVISSGKQPMLNVDNIQLPLTEDIYIDDLWHGTVWLEGDEWHELSIDSVKNFVHVSKEGTWRSVRATNTRKATKQRITTNEPEDVDMSEDGGAIKVVLFFIFILSAGFIWLAPKL